MLRTRNIGGALILITTLVLLILSSNIRTASGAEELTAVRGENTTISVILLQNGTFGNPVPEQRIEFYDQTNNSLLGIDITDSIGQASIIWDIPIDYLLGPTTINATFRGNESIFLLPSYQSIILNILASTNIILQNAPSIVAPGDTFSFSVVLLDDTSKPINDETITVYSNNQLLATAVTNSTGNISFSIHCNKSWYILGENAIQIVHEQNIENYYERAETLFVLEIQKLQTSIQSNFSLDSIELGDTLDFEVELKSIEGGISTNLDVLLDGSPLTTTTTDTYGNGTIHLNIDKQFSLGSHYFNIFYNGSERYTTISLNIEFNVLSPAIIDIKMLSSVIIGLETDMAISLFDLLGRPIDGTLIISDYSNGQNMSIQMSGDIIDINIKFPILEPVGFHDILMEIGNPFITNNSIVFNIVAWSQPEFTLEYSNILHFASPYQELNFIVKLTDWSGNMSFQSIQFLNNGQIISSNITDKIGFATIVISAPSIEGTYNLSIVSPKNLTRYELPAKLDYSLTVSTLIPVLVELDYYEVIPSLQQITIYLRVQCLNGSLIEGIKIKILWVSIENYATTRQDGTSVVQLPVPITSGNYTLYYEIEQNHNLAFSAGTINISVSLVDVLTSQGIGINGFAISILASFIIVVIPLIRQKYLII